MYHCWWNMEYQNDESTEMKRCFIYLDGVFLLTLPILLSIRWFLHLMALAHFQLCIGILWLGAMEHETSLLNMIGWCGNGKLFKLMHLSCCGLVRYSCSFYLYVLIFSSLCGILQWNQCSSSKISLYMSSCLIFPLNLLIIWSFHISQLEKIKVIFDLYCINNTVFFYLL